MLRSLAIRDFVIVDFVELDLSSGFTVFTGETGAGKSILIDALTLALGGRADASVVREGATRADIVAEFTGEQDSVIQHWLNEQALDHGEGVLLLRRVIDNAGRSKAFINGITATVTQLRELGEMLVDIHGQHAHQSLLRGDAQRQLVDAHAGLQSQVQQVASAYKQWRAVSKQREEFERDAKQALLERERLEWQVGELQKLAPQPGEWADVCNEHSRLSHAASLIDGAQQALDALSESDSSPMLSQLNSLEQRLGKLVDIDDKLKPVLDALEPARIQLQEAVYALHDYLGRIELDPQRLRVVEVRMEALHSASRKFHVAPEQLSQEFEQLSMRLQQLSDATDLDALRAQEEKLAEAYHTSAKLLSKARAAAAKSLSVAVTAAMQELSMSGGRFDIALHTSEPAAHGVEQIEFLVAGHAGTTPRPLAKVASGGELARISLAISVIASSATATPTLIFDEVDSGIGGAVAEVVGRLLRKLGQDRQVLCVTHLPQVASQAAQHFQVSKRAAADGRTVSSITPLTGAERVEEIARMLGGLEITATTRKHARELLAS
ncbi:MAG: repair protein RecN [Pseudomonadota bacterium]|jgi:DNA repair protein RecN (Recombination protein N)